MILGDVDADGNPTGDGAVGTMSSGPAGEKVGAV